MQYLYFKTNLLHNHLQFLREQNEISLKLLNIVSEAQKPRNNKTSLFNTIIKFLKEGLCPK